MRTCKNCHKRVFFLKLINGICKKCAKKALLPTTTSTKAIVANEIQPHTPKVSSQLIAYDNFIIHPDLRDLIWYCDGKLLNCTADEPSAISVCLPIEYCNNTNTPDYYPKYSLLTPQQRYLYLKMLENPYKEVDIGYIFLLYYGLERHLIAGNFDKSFSVILKLRENHTNKSFQNYSFNALITAALMKQRADLCNLLLNQQNQDYVLNINHFILYKILTNTEISAKELMKYARDFDYTNTHYIKDYPSLFESYLSSNLQRNPIFPCQDIDLQKVSKFNGCFFANMSFFSNKIIFSDYLSYEPFRIKCLTELYRTHEQVKNELKINRHLYTKQERTPTKKVIYNDSAYYPGINEYNDIIKLYKSKSSLPSIETLYDIHFKLNFAIVNIYKHRDHPLALEHVIDLCKKDIDLLNTYNEQLILSGAHVESYYKLCNIYEKQGMLDDAIAICNDAIKKRFAIHHDSEYFKNKYLKLIKKRKS